MRRIFNLFLALFIIFCATWSYASTTWYARDDGGTAYNAGSFPSGQCSGMIDAAYPGSGINQPCAVSHPAWVLGATGTPRLFAGGDTLLIDPASHINPGQQAQYMIGFGMPNTSPGTCNINTPYNCGMQTIPSGPDAAHPSKIMGKNFFTCQGAVDSQIPQLWGTQGLGTVGGNGIFTLSGASHIDLECMELTDHSNCGLAVGTPTCSQGFGGNVGLWARKGIYAHGGSDFTFKNMDIHGFADRDIHMGGINGITFSYVLDDAGYMVNWDGDVGESGNESAMTGTITVDHVKSRFAGCSEAYPRTPMTTYPNISTADYTHCTDQNANPPGYGDCWGFYITQGNWNITQSEWSHCTSDGLDLLYKNAGNVNVDKSLFEGNTGNQLKMSAQDANITNNIFIANCNYLQNAGKVYNTGSFSSCRANGTPIAATPLRGSQWVFNNNSSLTGTGSGGSPFIEVLDRYGICNGTETYTYGNNVLKNYNNTWTAYYNGLSGACSTAWNNAVTKNSDIYNFTSAPSGSGVVYTNPLWAGTFSITADSNVSTVYLQGTSPGKGNGASGLAYWNNSNDYNNYPQNTPIDQGGLQFGSTPSGGCLAPGNSCSVSGNCCSSFCCSGFCSSTACTPPCTPVGNSCSVGADCCSGNCCGGFCSSTGCGGAVTSTVFQTVGQCSTVGKTGF